MLLYFILHATESLLPLNWHIKWAVKYVPKKSSGLYVIDFIHTLGH